VPKRNAKSPRRTPGRPKSRLTGRVTLWGDRGRQDDPELALAMRAVASATTRQTFGRDLAAAVPGVVRRRGSGQTPFYEGIALKGGHL